MPCRSTRSPNNTRHDSEPRDILARGVVAAAQAPADARVGSTPRSAAGREGLTASRALQCSRAPALATALIRHRSTAFDWLRGYAALMAGSVRSRDRLHYPPHAAPRTFTLRVHRAVNHPDASPYTDTHTDVPTWPCNKSVSPAPLHGGYALLGGPNEDCGTHTRQHAACVKYRPGQHGGSSLIREVDTSGYRHSVHFAPQPRPLRGVVAVVSAIIVAGTPVLPPRRIGGQIAAISVMASRTACMPACTAPRRHWAAGSVEAPPR